MNGRKRLAVLVARPRWIIDGNYGGSLAQRMARADTVLFLDYPTALCLWRVLRRLLTDRGTTRPDVAPGCPERLNDEFLRYVARFRRDKCPAMLHRLAHLDGALIRFETPGAAEKRLSSL